MRSTHDHEDRVRYWLTDAEGGGLLMTMKTASGIGWPTPKAEVNQYLTRSSWSWVDRNQKSIIALLNYREFSFTKIEISFATAFYRAR